MNKKDKGRGKLLLGDEDKLFQQAMGLDSPSPEFEGSSPNERPSDESFLDESDSLFLQEMADMTGVEAKEDAEESISPLSTENTQPPSEETVATSFDLEDTLFVSAFEDHLPPRPLEVPTEETSHRPGTQEKWKAIQKGMMPPDATLDLHGHTEEQAKRALKLFLEKDAKSLEIVLVIVGKGYRSKGLPVLSTALPEWLNKEFHNWVIEWKWAPRHLGGSGAALVKIRPSSL